jgi:mRNA-degrading endonuclease RelE of RelBE toxin-antitoxin system
METLKNSEKKLPKEVYEAISALIRFLEETEGRYRVRTGNAQLANGGPNKEDIDENS